jgi:hypothetical protein
MIDATLWDGFPRNQRNTDDGSCPEYAAAPDCPTIPNELWPIRPS